MRLPAPRVMCGVFGGPPSTPMAVSEADPLRGRVSGSLVGFAGSSPVAVVAGRLPVAFGSFGAFDLPSLVAVSVAAFRAAFRFAKCCCGGGTVDSWFATMYQRPLPRCCI